MIRVLAFYVSSGTMPAEPAIMTTPLSPPVSLPASAAPLRARYRELAPARIVDTAQQLLLRIGERFPGSGLGNIAGEVVQVAREALVRSEQIRRPNYGIRVIVFGLIAVMIGVPAYIVSKVRADSHLLDLGEFVQTFEAGLGSIVFLGAAIIFLSSREREWKRQRALAAIRELRALAHIVDMHQLTKDPEGTLRGQPTASSPKRSLTQFELGRYLDYCSELLSLINKIGAIYVQEFPDAVALEAVDQLSNLTNSLSRNIWQKLMILDLAVEPGRSSKPPLAAAERSAPAAE